MGSKNAMINSDEKNKYSILDIGKRKNSINKEEIQYMELMKRIKKKHNSFKIPKKEKSPLKSKDNSPKTFKGMSEKTMKWRDNIKEDKIVDFNYTYHNNEEANRRKNFKGADIAKANNIDYLSGSKNNSNSKAGFFVKKNIKEKMKPNK